jgi:hypothetical protein
MSHWIIRADASDTIAVLDMLARNRTAALIARSTLSVLQRPGDPARYAKLAHPGFSTHGDIAFVYGQFTCGPRCAWDEGFVLEWRGDTWVVVGRRRYTVS